MAVVDAFKSVTDPDMPDSTLSYRMFNDGKKIGELRGDTGASITVRRLEHGLTWLGHQWPDGHTPPDMVREHLQSLQGQS